MWLLHCVRHMALRVLLTLHSLSSESGRQVVSIGDGVTKSRPLAVLREVCDFLATLIVAYPGSVVG
jgi:hypothetical protein